MARCKSRLPSRMRPPLNTPNLPALAIPGRRERSGRNLRRSRKNCGSHGLLFLRTRRGHHRQVSTKHQAEHSRSSAHVVHQEGVNFEVFHQNVHRVGCTAHEGARERGRHVSGSAKHAADTFCQPSSQHHRCTGHAEPCSLHSLCCRPQCPSLQSRWGRGGYVSRPSGATQAQGGGLLKPTCMLPIPAHKFVGSFKSFGIELHRGEERLKDCSANCTSLLCPVASSEEPARELTLLWWLGM